MKTHREIVRTVGYRALAADIDLASRAVRAWGDRDSIPGAYWRLFHERGWATLDELASAADYRKQGG